MLGRNGLIAVIAAALLGALWLTVQSGAVGGASNTQTNARAEGDPQQYAVILMYHRFGEDRYPATSIRVEQFREHLAYLQAQNFNVLPLPEIVKRFDNGETLPPRTVAITVDDAYLSALEVARSMLEQANMPWTLFVTTDQPDRRLGDFMSWDQIRELDADPLVTIGHHSGSHHHQPDHDVATNRRDIERANARFEAELGHVPTLYAYPFGEYSAEVLDLIDEFDFVAAFGQHSGVAHAAEHRHTLPRFAMNENWGRMDRFEQRIHTKPLPVTDIRPRDVLVVRNNPPTLEFTLADPDISAAAVGCFPSGGIEADITRNERRLSVTPQAAFPSGRARINCTAPYGDGTFRWFGIQFVVREPARGGHVPRSDPGAGVPE